MKKERGKGSEWEKRGWSSPKCFIDRAPLPFSHTISDRYVTWCDVMWWCECQQGTFHLGNESYLLTSEPSRRRQRRQAGDDAATTTNDDSNDYVAYRIQTPSTNYTGHSYACLLVNSVRILLSDPWKQQKLVGIVRKSWKWYSKRSRWKVRENMKRLFRLRNSNLEIPSVGAHADALYPV